MNLLKALATVSSMTLLSRILGFFRDFVIARTFGAGMLTDAIFVAFRLPNLLRRLFAEGAFSQAFVPVLGEDRTRRGEEATKALVDRVTGALGIALLVATAVGIVAARDPTRGGLATTLNEISKQSNVVIELQDAQIPVKPQVQAACEMLGFDPLYLANEGKLVAFVRSEDAEKILAAMKQSTYGTDAVMIGKVIEKGKSQVRLKTAIGGTRLVDMLPGEMLPRIC